VHSAGGRAIRYLADPSQPFHEPSYCQEFIAGDPYSALFLVRSGSRRLLMISRQLVGWAACAPPSEWSYCGSIGPWPASPQMSGPLQSIAESLLDGIEYQGLMGLDFIWDGRRAWLIEVNPRYTASAELWELAARESILGGYLGCFAEAKIANSARSEVSGGGLNAKTVVYASETAVAPDLSRFLLRSDPWAMPFMADIPRPGIKICAGQPICTVFARGTSAEECERKLARRIARVRGWFGC
jgi:predicted ATP-grasp superfamily ATP-dependent carboligase